MSPKRDAPRSILTEIQNMHGRCTKPSGPFPTKDHRTTVLALDVQLSPECEHVPGLLEMGACPTAGVSYIRASAQAGSFSAAQHCPPQNRTYNTSSNRNAANRRAVREAPRNGVRQSERTETQRRRPRHAHPQGQRRRRYQQQFGLRHRSRHEVRDRDVLVGHLDGHCGGNGKARLRWDRPQCVFFHAVCLSLSDL